MTNDELRALNKTRHIQQIAGLRAISKGDGGLDRYASD
jgi:hypothetical protein